MHYSNNIHNYWNFEQNYEIIHKYIINYSYIKSKNIPIPISLYKMNLNSVAKDQNDTHFQIPMKYNPWLNTSSTFDENLADLAGMKVSYDTYVNWVHENGVEPQLPGLNYSPKQLFWISSAIHQCSKYSAETLQMYNANYPVHSSRQFRANGALQNLEEFAIDFGCAVDSRMNPMEKCTIW